jgi:quinol-cytochrome oxidoreductase complex cytochrome b subunit
MDWKTIAAKEWLWFLCTVIGAFLVMILIDLVVAKEPLSVDDMWFSSWMLVVLFYCVRLTVLAIKQIRKEK